MTARVSHNCKVTDRLRLGLEANVEPTSPHSPASSGSPRRVSGGVPSSVDGGNDERALSRLHDIFHYQGRGSVVLESRRASITSSLNGGAGFGGSPGPSSPGRNGRTL